MWPEWTISWFYHYRHDHVLLPFLFLPLFLIAIIESRRLVFLCCSAHLHLCENNIGILKPSVFSNWLICMWPLCNCTRGLECNVCGWSSHWPGAVVWSTLLASRIVAGLMSHSKLEERSESQWKQPIGPSQMLCQTYKNGMKWYSVIFAYTKLRHQICHIMSVKQWKQFLVYFHVC